MSFPMSEVRGTPVPEGFTLKVQEGEVFLDLFFEGKKEPVAIFSSFGATPSEVEEEIKKTAADYLTGLKKEE